MVWLRDKCLNINRSDKKIPLGIFALSTLFCTEQECTVLPWKKISTFKIINLSRLSRSDCLDYKASKRNGQFFHPKNLYKSKVAVPTLMENLKSVILGKKSLKNRNKTKSFFCRFRIIKIVMQGIETRLFR